MKTHCFFVYHGFTNGPRSVSCDQSILGFVAVLSVGPVWRFLGFHLFRTTKLLRADHFPPISKSERLADVGGCERTDWRLRFVTWGKRPAGGFMDQVLWMRNPMKLEYFLVYVRDAKCIHTLQDYAYTLKMESCGMW